MADQTPNSSAELQNTGMEELLYFPVSRGIYGTKSSEYSVDRITSDNIETAEYKTVRIVKNTNAYEESCFAAERNISKEEQTCDYHASRKVLSDDIVHANIYLEIFREPINRYLITRNINITQDKDFAVRRQLEGSTHSRGLTRRNIFGAKDSKNGDAKVHYMTYVQERSVYAVHRSHANSYGLKFLTHRDIANQETNHKKIIRSTGNAFNFLYESERKLRGTVQSRFRTERDIIGAVERSIYVPFLRYIEPEQTRTIMRRMIGSGHATYHYPISRQRYARASYDDKVMRSLSIFDNSYWPTVRGVIKTPEEYFGKICIYKQNVSNLIFDKSSADANVALVKDVKAAEYDLDLMETREEVHGKIDNRGHYTSQTDKKIKYYPPLNSLSSVMILPNWNSSPKMLRICREKHMVVEAYPLSGKKYNLHIRFDEPPEVPLYFTVLIMNPDRTIEGGNPTVTNLLLDTGLTEDDIKKLQDIISKAS